MQKQQEVQRRLTAIGSNISTKDDTGVCIQLKVLRNRINTFCWCRAWHISQRGHRYHFRSWTNDWGLWSKHL